MPKNGDASSSGGDPLNKQVEIPPRSTTPEGDPPQSVIRDFATGYRSRGTPSQAIDFATGYRSSGVTRRRIHFPKDGPLSLFGTLYNFRTLEPSDPSFKCHDVTFHDGRVGKDGPISRDKVQEYLEKYFKSLGSRKQFHDNSSLYEDLANRVKKDKEENKGRVLRHIAVYTKREDNERVISHSSPIAGAYRKEDGSYTIKLWGKWGGGPIGGDHDIEDLPYIWRDRAVANWEIYFTDREKGRIMDL